MSIEIELADYIEQNSLRLAQDQFVRNASTYNIFPGFTPEQSVEQMSNIMQALSQALRGNQKVLHQIAVEGVRQIALLPNTSVDIIATAANINHEMSMRAAEEAFPDDLIKQATAKNTLIGLNYSSDTASYTSYVKVREEQLREREQELNQLQHELESVSAAVRELSAPIAPIHDNVLVLPLVGSIDTNRAQSITEDLLEEIVARQSDFVIIDITGVPIVDTSIANYLLQTTKAVSLLGAEVILVGISAEVAQTIVGLDIDLRQLVVRANLQDGIAYALEQVGLGIQPLEHHEEAA